MCTRFAAVVAAPHCSGINRLDQLPTTQSQYFQVTEAAAQSSRSDISVIT